LFAGRTGRVRDDFSAKKSGVNFVGRTGVWGWIRFRRKRRVRFSFSDARFVLIGGSRGTVWGRDGHGRDGVGRRKRQVVGQNEIGLGRRQRELGKTRFRLSVGFGFGRRSFWVWRSLWRFCAMDSIRGERGDRLGSSSWRAQGIAGVLRSGSGDPWASCVSVDAARCREKGLSLGGSEDTIRVGESGGTVLYSRCSSSSGRSYGRD
jgi:hypothetical protein